MLNTNKLKFHGPLKSLKDLKVWSGGARGSDTYWAEIAYYYGVQPDNIHALYYRNKPFTGNHEISDSEYQQGLLVMYQTCKYIHRRSPKQLYIKYLIARNYIQVLRGDMIIAIAEINDDNTVSGGTGWAIEMTKVYFPEKLCYVYNLKTGTWYVWNSELSEWTPTQIPVITTENVTLIGTRNIDKHKAYGIMDSVFKNTKLYLDTKLWI